MLQIIPYLMVTLRIGGILSSETYCYSHHLILVENFERSISGDSLMISKLSLFDLEAKTVTYFSPDMEVCFTRVGLPAKSPVTGWTVEGKITHGMAIVQEEVISQGVKCIYAIEKTEFTVFPFTESESHYLFYSLDLDESVAPFLGFFEHQKILPKELAQYRYVLSQFLRHEDEDEEDGCLDYNIISTEIKTEMKPKYPLELLLAVPRVSEADFMERN